MWCLLFLLALLCLGCDSPKSAKPEATPATTHTAAANAATANAAPPKAAGSAAAASTSAAAADVKPYTGKTGTVVGVITIKGDKAPLTHRPYPTNCHAAAAIYGKLFRVGQDGQLADALVTVTGYKGFVPAKNKAIKIIIKGCAYSSRTITMTDGQHLQLSNKDNLQSYVPYLDGARAPAQNVAIPRGLPIKLYSRGPGRYWLRDQMGKNFMVADVFHLRYSTASVTKLDGKFRIEGVPIGKATLGVLLPAANMKTLSQDIVVKEGDNNVHIAMKFDAKKDVPPSTSTSD